MTFEKVNKLGCHKRPDVSERNRINPPMEGKKNPKRGELNKVNPPMKGKKRPDLSEKNKINNPAKHPEVKAKLRMKRLGKKDPKHSKFMKKRCLDGFATYMSSCNKNPSKPQVKLFEQVKLLYPSAILNYPYKNYSIDIAIPELKIAIEYDEPYWHKDKEEADKKRQIEIEKGGWKFIRYSKLPKEIVI
jgi:hypothetical protein